MQCKDIPEEPILRFLDALNGRWAVWYQNDREPYFDNSVQLAMPPNLPSKLIVAKMGQMIKKGIVDGCPCGCRGDYVITEKGKALLAAPPLSEKHEKERKP